MPCHLAFLPVVSAIHSSTRLADFLLSQVFETWKMLLSLSFSLFYSRETPNKTHLKTSLVFGHGNLWINTFCSFGHLWPEFTPWACYLVIPQVFVGQGENQITGRGAQDSILQTLSVRSASPFFLLSCLSEWLLYAKPCARCWGYSSGQKKQKSHRNGTHTLGTGKQ